MSDDNLILFPEFEKLKNEVEKMRTELSMLLLERDELEFVICKNIETEYMLKLGGLEYKVYEAQCRYLRLLRKVELIQAKLNRQEKVIISAIETALDAEFAEHQKSLDAQIEKMNAAIRRSKLDVLSEEDTKELKKVYRKIVKALHPDLNPEVTDAQIQLFENAVTAYQSGDLTTLRVIGEMMGSASPPAPGSRCSPGGTGLGAPPKKRAPRQTPGRRARNKVVRSRGPGRPRRHRNNCRKHYSSIP